MSKSLQNNGTGLYRISLKRLLPLKDPHEHRLFTDQVRPFRAAEEPHFPHQPSRTRDFRKKILTKDAQEQSVC